MTEEYQREEHNDYIYYIEKGFTLTDAAHVWREKIDKTSGKKYFVRQEDGERKWRLPNKKEKENIKGEKKHSNKSKDDGNEEKHKKKKKKSKKKRNISVSVDVNNEGDDVWADPFMAFNSPLELNNNNNINSDASDNEEVNHNNISQNNNFNNENERIEDCDVKEKNKDNEVLEQNNKKNVDDLFSENNNKNEVLEVMEIHIREDNVLNRLSTNANLNIKLISKEGNKEETNEITENNQINNNPLYNTDSKLLEITYPTSPALTQNNIDIMDFCEELMNEGNTALKTPIDNNNNNNNNNNIWEPPVFSDFEITSILPPISSSKPTVPTTSKFEYNLLDSEKDQNEKNNNLIIEPIVDLKNKDDEIYNNEANEILNLTPNVRLMSPYLKKIQREFTYTVNNNNNNNNNNNIDENKLHSDSIKSEISYKEGELSYELQELLKASRLRHQIGMNKFLSNNETTELSSSPPPSRVKVNIYSNKEKEFKKNMKEKEILIHNPTESSSIINSESIQNALKLLHKKKVKSSNNNNNNNTVGVTTDKSPHSSIPKPTQNHPNWWPKNSKRSKSNSSPSRVTNNNNNNNNISNNNSNSNNNLLQSKSSLSARSATAARAKPVLTPYTSSFSHVLQKEAKRARLQKEQHQSDSIINNNNNNNNNNSGGVYPTSFEDRPKTSVVSPVIKQKSTNNKILIELEPIARKSPPAEIPLFVSTSTFLYARNKFNEKEIQTSLSESLSNSVTSSSYSLSLKKQNRNNLVKYSDNMRKNFISKSKISSSDTVYEEYDDKYNTLNNDKESNKDIYETHHDLFKKEPSFNNSIQHNNINKRKSNLEKEKNQNYLKSHLIVPKTSKRWSDNPVFDIADNASSTRAPSTGSIHPIISTIPPVRKIINNNKEEIIQEKEKENQNEESNQILFSQTRQLLPIPSVLDAEFEIAAQRFYGTKTEEDKKLMLNNKKDINNNLSNLFLSENNFRKENLENIIHRCRESVEERESDMLKYLRPEEQLLWQSLNEKFKSLQVKSTEIKKKIIEWDSQHKSLSINTSKNIKLVQTKTKLAMKEWEKTENICWEYFTLQLVNKSWDPLGFTVLPPFLFFCK